jgi:hypothetical protein
MQAGHQSVAPGVFETTFPEEVARADVRSALGGSSALRNPLPNRLPHADEKAAAGPDGAGASADSTSMQRSCPCTLENSSTPGRCSSDHPGGGANDAAPNC